MLRKRTPAYVLPAFVRGEAITNLERLDAWTTALAALKEGVANGVAESNPSEMGRLDAAYNSARDTYWSMWSAWYERCMPTTDLPTIAAVMGSKSMGTSVTLEFAAYEVWLKHEDDSPEVQRAVHNLQLAKAIYNAWHPLVRRLLTTPVPELKDRLTKLDGTYPSMTAGLEELHAILGQ